MTAAEMINVTFKLSDQINFLWNFFVVFSAIFLGWVFSTSMSWDLNKRRVLVILFVIFALINSNALANAYSMLELALVDLRALTAGQEQFATDFFAAMSNAKGLGPFKARFVHYAADLLIIFLIVKTTRKKELDEQSAT